MTPQQAATKRRLSVTERGVNDIFDALRMPFAIISMELDMSRALQFIREVEKETRRWLPLPALLVRASAMSVERAPEMLDMLHGSRLIRPSTIDVSVSVAGSTNLAPLAIVRDAVNKSLLECSEELVREVRRLRESEPKNIRLINRYGWLLPHFLRRIFLRLYLKSYYGTKRSVGSFQISNLPAFCMDYAIVRAFSRPVMIAGAVKKRPFVVEDRLEVRPTCIFTFHADHRLIDAAKAVPLLKSFSALMEQHPEATLEKGSWVVPDGPSDLSIRI